MIQKLTEAACNCSKASNLKGLNAPNLNAPELNRPDFPGSLPGFDWPGIDEPGFPTLVAGTIGASLAGLNVLLDFIPLKFDDSGKPKIPEIPGIDLFVKGFTGSATGLPAIKAASIPVPGAGSIPLPDIPGANIPDISAKRLDGTSISLPGFDPTALLKVIGLFIAAPFLIIKGIIGSFPDIKIPTIDGITGIFLDAGASMGIDLKTLGGVCIPCIAEAIFNLIDMILPI